MLSPSSPAVLKHPEAVSQQNIQRISKAPAVVAFNIRVKIWALWSDAFLEHILKESAMRGYYARRERLLLLIVLLLVVHIGLRLVRMLHHDAPPQNPTIQQVQPTPNPPVVDPNPGR